MMHCVPVSNKLVYFSLFFNSVRNAAAAACAKSEMYLVRWCMEPIKLFSCLNAFGGESFSIASIFLINGVVPSLFIVYPSASACLKANLHLSNDMARFSASIFPESFVVFVCVYQLTPSSRSICRLGMHRCLSNW